MTNALTNPYEIQEPEVFIWHHDLKAHIPEDELIRWDEQTEWQIYQEQEVNEWLRL